jgi:hypothetical protein
MKLSKTIQAFEADKFSQEWEISVDADQEGVSEVLDIIAINYHNDKEVSRASIKNQLATTFSVDIIIDSIDWAQEYADTKAESINYFETEMD